jgi:hypothetical protein
MTMLTQAITLELPEPLFQRAQRIAHLTQRSLDGLLVSALDNALPPLSPDLPPDLAADLAGWATLDDVALRAIADATLPTDQQERFSELVHRDAAGSLTPAEQQEWWVLQEEVYRVSAHKSKAHYLLEQRSRSRAEKARKI